MAGWGARGEPCPRRRWRRGDGRGARPAAGGRGGGLRVEQLDLTDPGSVEAFPQRWLISGRPLHVLINNAAVFPSELTRAAGARAGVLHLVSATSSSLLRSCLPCVRRGARVW